MLLLNRASKICIKKRNKTLLNISQSFFSQLNYYYLNMESSKSKGKVIVITGANKGIGYGVMQSLMETNEDTLILTSRNKELGLKAFEELKEKVPNSKCNLEYFTLDITKSETYSPFAQYIRDNYGQIDTMVNNAGVATKGDTFNLDVFDFTFEVNVYGTIAFTEYLIKEDLIRSNGKIIIVGSTAGQLKVITNEDIKSEFVAEDLDVDKILDLAKRFRKAIEQDTWKEEGWPASTYRVSKICINSYARVLGNRKEIAERGIQCYSCCPGWVKTDMGGPNAYRTLEEGVVTPVYLVNLEYAVNNEYQGKFFFDSQVYDFTTSEPIVLK